MIARVDPATNASHRGGPGALAPSGEQAAGAPSWPDDGAFCRRFLSSGRQHPTSSRIPPGMLPVPRCPAPAAPNLAIANMPTPIPFTDWDRLFQRARAALARRGVTGDVDDLAATAVKQLLGTYPHKPMPELAKLVVTIACNLAAAQMREGERRRLAQVLDPQPDLRPGMCGHDDTVDVFDESLPDDVFERECVRAAMTQLRRENARYYDALFLQHHWRLEQAEIAEVLSATVEDVNNWQRRGRPHLIRILKSQHNEGS